MTSNANVGHEVSVHRNELASIISKIMAEHTARSGCSWADNAIDSILCDLSTAIEKREICNLAKVA